MEDNDSGLCVQRVQLCCSLHTVQVHAQCSYYTCAHLSSPSTVYSISILINTDINQNVGQCPTRWPPCRKVWLMPTTRAPCSNAATTQNALKFAARTRNPLNLPGCPKLANRYQLLVGRSSPYCAHTWRRYCCITSFFSDCRYMP